MKKYYIITNKHTFRQRITQKGKVYDIVFRVQQAVDGEIIQKSLCGYDTKAKAKTAYLAWVSKNCSADQRPIVKKQVSEKKEPTVRDLIPLYITSLKNQNKESSIYDKKHIYDLFILPTLGSIKMTELTKEKLLSWQDDLWQRRNPKTNKFYTYKYLSKIRTYLTAFLNWVEERYSYKNNLVGVKKPKRIDNLSKVGNFWTKEEFTKFLSVVTDPKYRALFSMLFYTGRRKGEIMALSPEDVQGDYIVINKTYSRKTLTDKSYLITANKNTKTGKSYVPEDLRRELNAYVAPNGSFFFGGKKPLSEHAIAYAFDRAIELSGVKRIRIHDLRHSFVSRLIHLGASPYMVADAIGDNVEQVFKTYGHLYETDKLDILKRL